MPTTRVVFVALLLLGLLWRTLRYLLAFPIWGDEAMLGMNLVTLDYVGLTQRLDNCQVAPVLFLWVQRAVLEWLGSGELAMRLVPFLAGIGGLLLFAHWLRTATEPLTAACAMGFLAVAIWPVSMGTLLKPYSLDLLASLLLLVPASEWLRSQRTRWLLLLTVLVPVALLASYPAVFVAGSVSLALISRAWRCGWFWAYNLAMLVAFALVLQLGERQMGTVTNGVSTAAGMNFYWADAFPPATWWHVPGWFVLQTTGQMAAFPVGASNGGSAVTVLLAIAGGVALVRRGRSDLVLLCVGPIVLNLIAACLGRYPYGASGRLSQHLAAGICLLAGQGLAELCQRRQGRGLLLAASVFACIGLGGMVRDLVHPYRDAGVAWMRDTAREMRRLTAGDPVVIDAPPELIESVFAWFWLNQPHVGWSGHLPASADSARQMWQFQQGDGAAERPGWTLAERIPYVRGDQRFALLRWIR